MNLNTISVEDFHHHLYKNYTKKSISINAYFDQGHVIHRIYEHNRLDLLQAIASTYGFHHLSEKNDEGYTILHTAVKISKINTQQLVSFGADLSIQDPTGSTPFHYICKKYDVAFVRSLEGKELIDVNQEDGDGFLPAFIALIEGDHKLFIYLLEQTINIDHADHLRNTMLHYACWLNKQNAVSALLKHDAYKTYKNKEGLIPYDLTTDSYIKLRMDEKSIDILASRTICSKCELVARMPYEFKCGHIYCYECLAHCVDIHDGGNGNKVVNCIFDCTSASDVELFDIIDKSAMINANTSISVNNKYYHYKFNKILANSLVGYTNIKYLDSLVIISDNVHLVLLRNKDMLVIKIIYQHVYKSYSDTHRLQLLKKIMNMSKQSMFSLFTGSLYLNNDRLNSTITLRLDILNYNEMGDILSSIIMLANWVHCTLKSCNWDAELSMVVYSNDIYPIYKTVHLIDKFLTTIGAGTEPSYTFSVDKLSVIIIEETMGLRIRLYNDPDMQAIVISTYIISIDTNHLESYEYLARYISHIDLLNFRIQVSLKGDVAVHTCINYVHNDISPVKGVYSLFKKECNRLKKSIMINCAYVEEV